MGWLKENQTSTVAVAIADDLAEARRAASQAATSDSSAPAAGASAAQALDRAADELAKDLRSARARLGTLPSDFFSPPVSVATKPARRKPPARKPAAKETASQVSEEFQRDLIDPADRLAKQTLGAATDASLSQFRDQLSELARKVGSYELRLRESFEREAAKRLASGDASIARVPWRDRRVQPPAEG